MPRHICQLTIVLIPRERREAEKERITKEKMERSEKERREREERERREKERREREEKERQQYQVDQHFNKSFLLAQQKVRSQQHLASLSPGQPEGRPDVLFHQ